MYFDPPWGGKDYKKETDLDLYLGNTDVFSLCLDIIKSHPKLLLIILKVPYNFNRKNKNYTQLYDIIDEVKFDTLLSRNIIYLFLDISKLNKKYNIEEFINLNSKNIFTPITIENNINNCYLTSFNSINDIWLEMKFVKGRFPTLDYKIKRRHNYTRIYFFTDYYEQCISKLIKLLYYSNDIESSYLYFMTKKLLSSSKYNLIIVDINKADNLKEIILSLLDNELTSYISTKTIDFTNIYSKLYPIIKNVYSSIK